MDIFNPHYPEIAFHPLEQFPELKYLADNYAVIASELENNTFWMDWGSDQYDPSGHCKFKTGDWTVCPIHFGRYNPYSMNIPGTEQFNVDELLKSLPERFPQTIALLKNIERINFSAFSRLHPHSILAPHKHSNPFSLIFHLGLKIPPNNTCGLTVQGETHTWTKPGDAVIFNDNLEHSAWNQSDQDRVILYVDFVRFFVK